MTYEEAIKIVKNNIHNDYTWVIVETLEKQIPKKPTGNKMNCCPSCKGLVGINTDIIHAKYNYCNHCGQAIDWSDE